MIVSRGQLHPEFRRLSDIVQLLSEDPALVEQGSPIEPDTPS